ncbi:prolyl oligopeptidase family serine peptidase [Pendulispora albinea]|uniref:prolyl oligopeptidase n=1 Tax=Pendulispora albinea TaxID=2741071 RepID=A0ABZ2LSU2_9BACT
MSDRMRAHRLAFALVSLVAGCGGAPSEPSATPAPAPAAAPPPRADSTPAPSRLAYPPTAKRPETFDMVGMSFRDEYGWLRNPADPEVTKWIDAQNDFTTANLRGFAHLDELRARFQELTRSTKPALQEIRSSRLGFFGLRRAPTAPQPALVLVDALEKPDAGRVVLDPAVLDPSGQTAIDWYAVSADGKRVAVSLSTSGSEVGSLSIFDTATGKRIDGPIPRVQYPTGGGSAAFSGDGRSIFYTRYPAAGERPEADMQLYQELYRHTIGAPIERDERVALASRRDPGRPEAAAPLPDIAEIELGHPAKDGTIVARVRIGDGGDCLWLVGQPSAKGYAWSRFAEEADAVGEVKASSDALYVLSRKGDLRGAILRVPLRSGRLADAKVVVPPSDRELTDMAVAGDALVVFDILRGSSRARAFDRSGKLRGEVRLPARATVNAATATEAGALYVMVESFTEPLSIQRLDARTLDLHKTPIFGESPARFDDVEISDEVATSRDGTRVPITILAPRGVSRSATTPLLLTGYGGYGVSSSPRLDARRRVWFDQGGVLAVAHIRGGGDNGEAWHVGGKLGRKQNVFDDFIACAERLVAAGYTSTSKLAITGRSNGGLLMGAVLAQRPNLVRAVVAGVPIIDMVRTETWPNGRFNMTEYGSLRDPEVRPKLLAYSPYQNLKPAAYPAVLLLSGATDGRVDPADARAFAAKLQDLTTSSAPVLLRTWMDAGHGMGTNVFKRAEEDAQTYAFLFHELGVTYRSKAHAH